MDGIPDGPATGTLLLTPSATTDHPAAQIADFELLVDGVSRATVAPGGSFEIDTTQLADGWHDWRVLAYDTSPNRTVGVWQAWFDVYNRGRGAAVGITPYSGDLSTVYQFALSASGAGVTEVRLLQNGRVIAARDGTGTVSVHGAVLGAGMPRVQCEVLFVDGEVVRSVPDSLLVDATGGGASDGAAPMTYGYTRRVRHRAPLLLELPASTPEVATPQTTVLSPPAQADVLESPGLSGINVPYRLLRIDPAAHGTDSLVFQSSDTDGTSAPATVTLLYDLCPSDVNDDRKVDSDDLAVLLMHFGTATEGFENGDLDGNGVVDLLDLSALLVHFGDVCP